MAEQFDIVKFGTVKRYINDVLEMRSSDTSVDTVRGRTNDLIKSIIMDAKDQAREEDLKTIQVKHMKASVEEHLGAATMDPEEIFKQLKKQDPVALGKLNSMIQEHLEELTE